MTQRTLHNAATPLTGAGKCTSERIRSELSITYKGSITIYIEKRRYASFGYR